MATSVKMLAPNETIWWVPLAGVAVPALPTKVEINAGTNISCAIVAGGTLNPTDPTMDNSKSICDSANVDNPILDQYEGNLTFFRDANPATGTSVFNIAWALFKTAGAQGYLIRRYGQLSTVVAATGDDIESFKFEADWPKSIDGGETPGPIQWTTKFIPLGFMSGLVTLA
jgi:hypothetical protein